MSELTCADCRAYLPKFYARTLSRRLNREVVEHLRRCDDCLRLAEQQKEKQSYITKAPPPHTWRAISAGKGQALIKWGGILFALMLTVSLSCFTYGSATEEAVQSQLQSWAELRYSAGKLGPEEIDWTAWLPYYRHEVHYPLLQQRLPGENRRLGTVVVSQRAWQRQVDVRLTQPENPLFLALPGEEGRQSSTSWEAIEQLPASVTVDMAVSTRHFLTPRATVEMLARYNTELQQVYVYGGETAEERRQLPPLALKLQSVSHGNVTLEESGHALLEKLEEVAQHPVLAEEHGIWERRLAYVDEHGFRTYGALVRGTPQALLQLQEVLELREAVIVNIDWLYES